MKTMVLVALTTFFGVNSFAITSSLTTRAALCNAVEKALVESQADMAMASNCMSNKSIRSKRISDGTILVTGVLEFAGPSRPNFFLNCEVAYSGSPENTIAAATCR